MACPLKLCRWIPKLIVLSLCLSCAGNGSPSDDRDGDGFGATADCDDDDPSIHPGAQEIANDGIDQNCDGMDIGDADGDGFDADADDCDDTNASIYPGAPETPYDGVDQDCNGADLSDVDADGYDAVEAGGDDCDDGRSDTSPIGVDICDDGVDQDCSGMDLACNDSDEDMDGHSTREGDCNDRDAAIHPGATEVPYNGQDDDCDPITRDNDLDADGFIHPGDCDDDNAEVFPGADEIPYDGVDQNCDGLDLRDVDKDGHEAVIVGGDDCDDIRGDINPGIPEIPYDSLDQDCDGRDLIGAPNLVTGAPRIQSHPRAAFGPGKYLVVWDDGRDLTAGQIYGRFVDPVGNPMGAEFLIHSTPPAAPLSINSAVQADVASDGSGFLVVWREKIGSAAPEIYGLLLDSNGTATGSPALLSAVTTGNLSDPVPCFGAGTYLVTWNLRFNFLYARTIGDTGTLGAISTIRDGRIESFDVASDGSSFLITWHLYNTAIEARPVDAAGTPTRPSATVVARTNALGAQVAYDGTNYLVTTSVATDVYGQRVDANGSPIGSSPGANILVSNAFGSQTAPWPAYVAGAYSVVFIDTRWGQAGLYTQRVGDDGVVFASRVDDNVPLFAGEDAVTDLSFASGGDSGLVAFVTGGDIYAHLIEP